MLVRRSLTWLLNFKEPQGQLALFTKILTIKNCRKCKYLDITFIFFEKSIECEKEYFKLFSLF